MLNLNHGATDGFGAAHVLGRIAHAYSGEPVAPLLFLAGVDLPVRPAIEHFRDRAARPIARSATACTTG